MSATRPFPTPPLVCLITPGHISSTPRLVKEADALHGAGYGVHVVASRYFPPVYAADAALYAAAPWPRTVVNYGGGARIGGAKLLRRLARLRLARSTAPSLSLAIRAHYAATPRLAARAAEVPADLYLGHGVAGLAAAAGAARRRGTRYGFDAEDFHSAETEGAGRAETLAIRTIEGRLLPGCAHLTAASPMIAQAYREAYRLERAPTTVLNVFPLAQAPEAPPDPDPVCERRPARFYWFSQTIGPGRGLEAAIATLGRMRTPVQLSLRGFGSADYFAHLRRLAEGAKLRHEIQFEPVASPLEMVRLAAGADLGLSLEEPRPLNRNLCLTNKIFAYLLAGIPQLLSATAAQKAMAADLGEAAILCDLDRCEETAQTLDAWFRDPARVAAARQAARTLGRSRYNWEAEQGALLSAMSSIFPCASS